MLNSLEPCFMKIYNGESNKSLIRLIKFIITNNINNGIKALCSPHIENLKKITTNCNYYIGEKYTELLGNYNIDKQLQKAMDELEILYKLYDIVVEKLKKKNNISYDRGLAYDYENMLYPSKTYYNVVTKAVNNDEKMEFLRKNNYDINYLYNFLDNNPPEYNNKALYQQKNIKSYVDNFTEEELKTFISNYNEEKKTTMEATMEATIEDNQVSSGGKRKSKDKSKKVSKKPVVSQKKQSIYKEILGKQMKIYKMPDSRKEYVKYKGDLHLITDYKSLIMKQKANAKPKAKPKK